MTSQCPVKIHVVASCSILHHKNHCARTQWQINMFITKTKTNSLHFHYRLEIKPGLTDGETILTNYFLFSTKHHQLSKKISLQYPEPPTKLTQAHDSSQDSCTRAQSQTTNNLLTPNFWRDRRCRGPKILSKLYKSHH